MKGASRFFSTLMYIAAGYSLFTAILCYFITMKQAVDYSIFAIMILLLTAGSLLATIVLNILKCKWSSFFVMAAANIVRVYLAFLLTRPAQQFYLSTVGFYKQHLPALLVVLFALISTLCYKKYLKNERGVTFQKTENDRQRLEEKEETVPEII